MMETLSGLEERALMGFKRALLIHFSNLVKLLILFGSKAWGDSSEWSDGDESKAMDACADWQPRR